MIDPYRDWLSIPEDCRPPNHYQLLQAPPDADADLIESAAASRLAVVRRYQVGRFSEVAQRTIGEISAAYAVLADPISRREYDVQLRGEKIAMQTDQESPVVGDCHDGSLPPLRVESTWTPSDEPDFPNPLRPDEEVSHRRQLASALLGLAVVAIVVAAIVAATY